MPLTGFALWLNEAFAGIDGWLLGCLHALQQSPAGAVLSPLAVALHWIGAGGIGLIALGLVLACFRKTRRCGAALLLALLLGALLTNVLLKPLVARPRPYADEAGIFHQWWLAAGAIAESPRSFPSGHATAAMAAMTALFWFGDKRYSWTAFLFALAMALSRCYLVVHYPSDVLGGLLVGFTAGAAASILIGRLWRPPHPHDTQKE